MILAAVGAALDQDAIEACWEWIEEKVQQTQYLVVVFEHVPSLAAVQEVVTPRAHLHCLHVSQCTTPDDFVVFGALYALIHKVSVANLLRFTAPAFHPLTMEVERAACLQDLFSEIHQSLEQGHVQRAQAGLSMLRQRLSTYEGTLCAQVHQRAGECKLLIEGCHRRHFGALPDGSLYPAAKKKPLETWQDLFPLIDLTTTASAISSWPEITADLHRLRAFIDAGKTACSRDVSTIQKGGSPSLAVMLWLTAYLVRVSEYYQSMGDGSAAIAVAVRALECYVDFRLFEANVLDYDPDAQKLIRTWTADQLFSKYRKEHGDGLQGALKVLTDHTVLGPLSLGDVHEVVLLRNRCAFAHGVQRLSPQDAKQAFARVKSFIKSAEGVTPALGVRWDNLLKESFLIDWVNVQSSLFASLLPPATASAPATATA